MRVSVRRWGNSAAVRIPVAMLAAVGLKPDDPVEIRDEGGRLVIEPIRDAGADLDTLLAAITPENRHDEVDFGAPVGREIG